MTQKKLIKILILTIVFYNVDEELTIWFLKKIFLYLLHTYSIFSFYITNIYIFFYWRHIKKFSIIFIILSILFFLNSSFVGVYLFCTLFSLFYKSFLCIVIMFYLFFYLFIFFFMLFFIILIIALFIHHNNKK